MRVVCYLNQFFGGLGGEEAGGKPLERFAGARGPGLLLGQLHPDMEIVATLVAGDNYAAENLEALQADVVAMLAADAPDVFIAGPGFNAGRYGLACTSLCKAANAELDIPALTGLFVENPAVAEHRRDVPIVSTEADVMGMRAALEAMGRVASKLVAGEPISASDGLIARGLRQNYFADATGAERAVDMLMAKLAGDAFTTEYRMPEFDRVDPAPPVVDAGRATIALVTSGGIVPHGNPDRIESASASKYGAYPLAGLTQLTAESHQSVHGGYDPTFANADPNRVLPLDAARSLEREGRIGHLFDTYFATVGNATSVERARRFGADIAAQLVNEGVQAVILTST